MHGDFTRYVILLSELPGRQTTRELVKGHVQHLKKLDREGKLVLCGPFTDYKGGMVIVKAADIKEAENMALADPFVSAGTRSYEIRTLELSCEENNHMGMG